MSRESDIQAVLEAFFKFKPDAWHDKETDAVVLKCPLCKAQIIVNVNDSHGMKDIKHDQSCAYLIAKDLSAKR